MEASADNAVVQALLDEQAALRRVATLVATAGEPARVFPTVTEEVGRLLGAPTANMVRYRHDGTADVIGAWNEPGVPSMPLGARIELDGETLAPKICRSGQPERVDDYGGLTGRLAERLQRARHRLRRRRADRLRRRAVGLGRRLERPHPRLRGRREHRIAGVHRARRAGARERRGARAARRVAGARGRRRRRASGGGSSATSTTARSSGSSRSPSALRIADRLIDEDPAAAHAAIARASEELSASLAELRELARGLHPAVLTDHGLERGDQVARCSARRCRSS